MLLLLLLLHLSLSLASRVAKPYVESYWESWHSEDYPDDFAALLKNVPASPPGACSGVNLVNIAFGDYSGGIAGQEAQEEVIRQGIEAIHEKGGLVKIALGGALYSMGQYVTDVGQATQFAEAMQATAMDLGLDGMDLDVEDSGAGADVQVAVIRKTRRLLPEFHISYTIPASVTAIEPWHSVIKEVAGELDAVNVMAYDYYWQGYTFDIDLDALNALGVPAGKVVYGIMPGHSDAPNEYTSAEDTESVARYALDKGLAGVMTWDINRDCRQRMYYGEGEDNLYQTGQGDAKFLDILSSHLNTC